MASEVWKYFKIDRNNDGFARCNICDKLVSRGGASKTTSNLLKHLKAHQNKGKIQVTVSNSGLLNKAGEPRPNPVASRPRPTSNPIAIASTSKSTFHSFFNKPNTETRPRPTSPLGLHENATEFGKDPDDPCVLSVDIGSGSDHLEEHMPREVESEDDMSVSTFSPTSSIVSQNLSLLSPDSETQARSTTSPSTYPKVIKLQEKKQITIEGALDRVSKFSQNDERSKKIAP